MNTTTTSPATSKRTLVFLTLFLLSAFGMFGQEVPAQKEVTPAPAVEVAYESETDLVNWFMSTKQNNLNKEEQATTKGASTTKRQIITSGSQPNKVLYRTFVKRIASQETALV